MGRKEMKEGNQGKEEGQGEKERRKKIEKKEGRELEEWKSGFRGGKILLLRSIL